MKKILLATTALVGFAGFAAAEVVVTGSADMGIAGGSEIQTQFHNDIDVTFTMTGETDGGLTFGAAVGLTDFVEAYTGSNRGAATKGTGFNTNRDNNSAVFISGAFGTVTLGDTDGALDKVMDETAIGTALTDDHTTHAGYSGNGGFDGDNDGQVLRYDYSFGAFSVAASAEQDAVGQGGGGGRKAGKEQKTTFGVGVHYTGDIGAITLDAGLGFQTGYFTNAKGNVVDDDIIGVSVKGSMVNGFTGILNYTSAKSGQTHTAVGVGYTAGALTLAANFGVFDGLGPQASGFGVIANYDLGGGAVAAVGYGASSDNVNKTKDTNTFSAGMVFSF